MIQVVLIKLGGGLIAPKNWLEETPDKKTIDRLTHEIIQSGKRVVVVSGSGNFGHKAVQRYGIETADGVAAVRISAKKIGEIVSRYLPNSVLLEPHVIFISSPEKAVLEVLKAGKIPVLYGDVMDKPSGGWEIFSGEKIISGLVGKLEGGGFIAEKIVQVSVEEGVLDASGQVIAEINAGNWEGIKPDVGRAIGVDVTGGMLHKVEESLEIFKKYQVKTLIIGGKAERRLKEVLEGEKVVGTVIC